MNFNFLQYDTMEKSKKYNKKGLFLNLCIVPFYTATNIFKPPSHLFRGVEQSFQRTRHSVLSKRPFHSLYTRVRLFLV